MANWSYGQETLPVPAAHAGIEARSAYLAKVYGLLLTGIVAFFGAALLPVIGAQAGIGGAESIVRLAIGLPWFVSFLLLFGGSWLAHAVSRMPIVNLVAFYAFAAFFGFLTIPLVFYAIAATGGYFVLGQALGVTVLTMGSLSAFVLISKKDFSFLGTFLFAGFVVLISLFGTSAVGHYAFGMDLSVVSIALSVLAILVFSGYVLYDTSKILHHYTTDMVVAGALALLVDFIILFREILFLFVRARD